MNQYDPQLVAAIVGGIVGAVVGGAVAYIGGWLQAWLNRRRKRRSLATVMLAELRTADASTRSLYGGQLSIISPASFQSFTLVTEAVESFSPRTVSALLDFSSRLEGIRMYMDKLVAGAFPKSVNTDAMMRMLVVVALDRLEPLAAALKREGAVYSPFVKPNIPEGLEPGSTSIPPLPQSVFPDLDSATGGAKSVSENPKRS